MNSIIDFDLLKKQEELREEISCIKEEIDVLDMLLTKLQYEYYEVNSKINSSVQQKLG